MPSLDYGTKTERQAGLQVLVKNGLFVCPGQSWLCASPGGLLKERNENRACWKLSVPILANAKTLLITSPSRLMWPTWDLRMIKFR